MCGLPICKPFFSSKCDTHILAACIQASFLSPLPSLFASSAKENIGRVISRMDRSTSPPIFGMFSINVLSFHELCTVSQAAEVPSPAKCPIQLPRATVAAPTVIGRSAGRVPVDILKNRCWTYCEEKAVA